MWPAWLPGKSRMEWHKVQITLWQSSGFLKHVRYCGATILWTKSIECKFTDLVNLCQIFLIYKGQTVVQFFNAVVFLNHCSRWASKAEQVSQPVQAVSYVCYSSVKYKSTSLDSSIKIYLFRMKRGNKDDVVLFSLDFRCFT